MLPVLDRPLIQYAVDEAVDAGADTLIFVTNRYKHAIADYFDKAYELEAKLARSRQGRTARDWCRARCRRNVRCVFVTQPEALGLGHAVLCAKPVVGDEPFGVILPDDLIWNGSGAGRAAPDGRAFGRRETPASIAVEEVPREQTDKYGIVDATPVSDRAAKIRHGRREAQARRRAVESRDRRPLRAAGTHLRAARKDHARRRRRNPADRRDRGAACRSSPCSPTVSTARASTAATSSAWSRRRCTWRCRTRRSARRRGSHRESGARESGIVKSNSQSRVSIRFSNSRFPIPDSRRMDLSYILNHLGEDREQLLRRGRAADRAVVDLRVSDRGDDARRLPRRARRARLHARQQSDRRNPAQESRRARRRRGLPDVRQRRRRDLGRRDRERARRRSCDLRRAAVQLDARGAARSARRASA